MNICLNFSSCFFAAVMMFFAWPPCAYAFKAVPMFEITASVNDKDKNEPQTDGTSVENNEYFEYPAAFAVSRKNERLLLLDSAGGNINAFDFSGAAAGTLKIPFECHAIDMAWLPEKNLICLVFQDTAAVGIITLDESAGVIKIKTSALIDITKIQPAKKITYVQKLWPCGRPEEKNTALLLNAFYEDLSSENILIEYADKKIAFVKNFGSPETEFIGDIFEKSAVTIKNTENKSVLESYNKDTQAGSFTLPDEITPVDKAGHSCRTARLVGTDAAGSYYVETCWGKGEDGIKNAYVYKFDRSAKNTGRIEVPKSPEMLTNRFILVDLAGEVFYMRKNCENNRVQFYRFGVSK